MFPLDRWVDTVVFFFLLQLFHTDLYRGTSQYSVAVDVKLICVIIVSKEFILELSSILNKTETNYIKGWSIRH